MQQQRKSGQPSRYGVKMQAWAKGEAAPAPRHPERPQGPKEPVSFKEVVPRTCYRVEGELRYIHPEQTYGLLYDANGKQYLVLPEHWDAYCERRGEFFDLLVGARLVCMYTAVDKGNQITQITHKI